MGAARQFRRDSPHGADLLQPAIVVVTMAQPLASHRAPPAGNPMPFALGLALATLAFVGCAQGTVPSDGGDASDRETAVIDGSMEAAVDAPTDTPPAVDVYTCTGTTCTVANGTGMCVGGVCQVGSCMPGGFDLDHNARNGCECIVGVVSTSCATPTDLGTLSRGSMHLVQSLFTSATGEHWARVTFEPGGHPQIDFLTNPGMAFHFEVLATCMAASHAQCPDRTQGATGITSWEFFDTVPDAGTTHSDDPARMTAAPTTVIIHVTTSRAATTCDPYTLVVSND